MVTWRRSWRGLDIAGFLLCAAVLGPFLVWTLVIERPFFGRAPVIAAALLHFALALYYFMGARDWLVSRKPRRTRLLLLLLLLPFGVMALVIVPSVLLTYVACRRIGDSPRVQALHAPLRSLPAQLGVTAAAFGLLFPWMNMLWYFEGASYLPGPGNPVILMENPYYGTNADGLRGPRVAVEKTPGVRRLLFLGDSTTFGWPYPVKETYPYLVAARLEARTGERLDVVNAGVPGQELRTIHERLAIDLLRFDPDVVLLMDGVHYAKALERHEEFVGNDVTYDGHHLRRQYLPPMFFQMLVLGVVANPVVLPIVLLLAPDDDEEVTDAEHVAFYAGVVDDFVAAIAERGTPLVLLEYPSEKVPDEVRAIFREVARREGLPYLPLYDEMIETIGFASRDGVHPDREAHRRIAERVADYLIEQGIVAARAAPDGA